MPASLTPQDLQTLASLYLICGLITMFLFWLACLSAIIWPFIFFYSRRKEAQSAARPVETLRAPPLR